MRTYIVQWLDIHVCPSNMVLSVSNRKANNMAPVEFLRITSMKSPQRKICHDTKITGEHKINYRPITASHARFMSYDFAVCKFKKKHETKSWITLTGHRKTKCPSISVKLCIDLPRIPATCFEWSTSRFQAKQTPRCKPENVRAISRQLDHFCT